MTQITWVVFKKLWLKNSRGKIGSMAAEKLKLVVIVFVDAFGLVVDSVNGDSSPKFIGLSYEYMIVI